MRSHLRTIVVLTLALALLALFLHNVDLRGVVGEIIHARPDWLALSLATMFVNLAIRARRWQYLLEPLRRTTFTRWFRECGISQPLPCSRARQMRNSGNSWKSRYSAAEDFERSFSRSRKFAMQ